MEKMNDSDEFYSACEDFEDVYKLDANFPATLHSNESERSLLNPSKPQLTSDTQDQGLRGLQSTLVQEVCLQDYTTADVSCLAISQVEPYIALGTNAGPILIYAGAENDPLCETPYRVFSEHKGKVTALSWMCGILQLISGGLDKSVCIWDLSSEAPTRTQFFDSAVYAITILSPTQFVCAGKKKSLKIYQTNSNSIGISYTTENKVSCLEYNADRNQLAVGLHRGKVLVYNCWDSVLKLRQNIVCRNRFGIHAFGRPVNGLCFLGSNKLLVSTMDSRIRLVDVENGLTITKFKGFEAWNGSLGVTSSGQMLAIASKNSQPRLWSLKSATQKNSDCLKLPLSSGDCPHLIQFASQVFPIKAKSTNFNEILITVSSRGTLRIYTISYN